MIQGQSKWENIRFQTVTDTSVWKAEYDATTLRMLQRI